MSDFLSIGETSKKFNIPASTLRYYESAGLLDPVAKNSSGHRIYGEKEFRRINFICILKNAGIPIEEISRYVDLFHQGVDTIPERKQILVDQLTVLHKQVEDLNDVIHELEAIIENYEETLMKRELDNRRKDPTYG